MSSLHLTLRDLARKLSLAPSTVSMSLKNHQSISEATRDRVQQAAAELGYTPDPRIANVMSFLKKRPVDQPVAALAYLTKFSEEIHLEQHPVFHNYLLGARDRARELGYQLEYFNLLQGKLSGKRMTTVLQSRGIEGVIIPPLFMLQGPLDIDFDHFACITFGHSLDHEPINRISLDHFNAVLHSLTEVARQGYQRIGFSIETMKERVQHRWQAAHLMFLELHPEQARIPVLDQKYNRDIFLKWFFKHKPTAILSQRVDWTEYLYDEGLTCGVDYGFATLSRESITHDVARLPHAKLRRQLADVAGLNQNSIDTGRYAVEFLAQELALNLKGAPKLAKNILINGQWFDGPTLPKR